MLNDFDQDYPVVMDKNTLEIFCWCITQKLSEWANQRSDIHEDDIVTNINFHSYYAPNATVYLSRLDYEGNIMMLNYHKFLLGKIVIERLLAENGYNVAAFAEEKPK